MNNERFTNQVRRALPSVMPKASINAAVEEWLLAAVRSKRQTGGVVEGELPPLNTAASRV